MAHAENEIIINKPVDVVFHFLADGINNAKWRPGVVSIRLKLGDIGRVGTEYRQKLRGPGGRIIDGDYRITAMKLNKELSFEVTAGPARPTGNYYLETVPGGTKLKFILDFKPKGLMKLMGPMITKTMRTEVGYLSHLKEALEND